MLRTIVNYFSFVVAGALLLIMITLVQLWPTWWWLDVRSVRVSDSWVGQPIIMAVDRSINRNFRGEWIASIRVFQGGKWVSYCTARGGTNYRVDSALPDPLTLKWWTHPDCHPLPAGKYIMHTTWVVKGDSFMPDKSITVGSNIFEVKL